MQTAVVAPDSDAKWWVLDAAGLPVGRVAAEAARLLLGKHKPSFAPGVVCGDHVVIINAAGVALTGNKDQEPIYWHSQYPGGLKKVLKGGMRQSNPVRLVERTVKGMLPHNRHGAELFRRLRVYAAGQHPHEAQSPAERQIGS